MSRYVRYRRAPYPRGSRFKAGLVNFFLSGFERMYIENTGLSFFGRENTSLQRASPDTMIKEDNMSRLAIPTAADAPADALPMLDKVGKQLGFVPNIFRALSLSPPI